MAAPGHGDFMPDSNVNKAEMETDYFGQAVYGPGKRFFDDPVIDNIIESLMELAAQVWIERDRRLVSEAVLQTLLMERGDINLEQLIEQHQPSEELQQRRAREREAFAVSVFNSFSRHLDPNQRNAS
jgi:hypothetical protein